MTTAYTSLLGLALPVTGELSGTWGDTVNTAITSLLDSAVAGTTSITVDADITLTSTTGASNEARQAIILWNPASGTTTRNITAPAQSKLYTVINASGGTQSIVIRGAGPTTGVTIAKGESAQVAWNGSDFVKVGSSGGAATFTNLTVTGNTILGDAAADTLTVNATSTFAAPVSFQGQVRLPSTGRSAAAALTPTNPAFLYGVASTYTDTTSSGTLAPVASFYGFAQPTLSTSNVTTYTTAATLYIANAPATGGSATITNPFALYVDSGANYFGGAATFNSTLAVNGNTTLGDATGDTLTINAGTTTFVQGTANGVAYLNGSKVLTTGSGFTFNGTALTILPATEGVNFVASSPTTASQVNIGVGVFAGGRPFIGTNTNSNELDFGTRANADVVFVRNSLELMRMTANGLAIGTTSVGANNGLVVYGTRTLVRPLVQSYNATTSAEPSIQLSSGTTTSYNTYWGILGGTAASYEYYDNRTGTGDTYWQKSGANKMALYANGGTPILDVGMAGLSTSGGASGMRLAVYTGMAFGGSNGQFTYGTIRQNTSSPYETIITANAHPANTGVNGAVWLRSGNSGGGGPADLAYFRSDGVSFLNTTGNGGSDLNIRHPNGTTSGALSITASSAGGGGASYFLMGNNDSGGTAGPTAIISANRAIQFGAGDSFSSRTGGNFTEWARFNSTGNMGIGTTDTSNGRLNVVGPGTATANTLFLTNVDGTYNPYVQFQHQGLTGVVMVSSSSYGGTASNFTINVAGTDTAVFSPGRTTLRVGGGSSATTTDIPLTLYNNLDGGVGMNFVNGVTSNTNPLASIRAFVTSAGAGTDDGILAFLTATNGTSVERMRLDSSGNLNVGTTSTYLNTVTSNGGFSSIGTPQFNIASTNSSTQFEWVLRTGTEMQFYVSNASVMARLTASGVWTNSSDARYKENIRPVSYGLAELMQLQPRAYNVIGSTRQEIGFVAQEVEPLIPELVESTRNSVTEQDRLTLSYGQLSAVIVKAIQELKAEFDAYKASHP